MCAEDITAAPAVLVYWMGLSSSFADEVFIAGLFGMIPAAVCSWLAGR